MIGLIYIAFFVVYFVLSLLIVRFAYSFCHRRFNRGRTGALLAGFVMYNLVFWDWIPVLVVHKYYCATEAGFWVYKSPEQWIRENPEVIGKDYSNESTWRHESTNGGARRSWISERIYINYSKRDAVFDSIEIKEREIVDARSGQSIARAVEVFRGHPSALSLGASRLSDYKIWLSMGHANCGQKSKSGGYFNDAGKFFLELIDKTK